MKKYNQIKDNQFSDNKNNSPNDDPSGEKSIIMGVFSTIVSGIIGFITAKFNGDNWTIGILIMALCLFIVWVYNHMSKNPINIIKWQNHLKILFRLGVAIFCIVLTIDIWRIISSTSNKDSNTATIAEQSPVADIPIGIDLSFHSTHEIYQNNSINGNESRPVIPMSKDSFMRCLQAASQGEIKGEYYQRYRGDGEQQLFAIVEGTTDYEKSDENNLYGTIWYVDKYGPREFDSEPKEYIWPSQFFIDDNNGSVYLVYGVYHADGNIIYVLGVDETGPYHPVISGQGSDLRINEYDEIEITTLEDVSRPGENEIYYFCVEDVFKEYGGIEITLGELLNIKDSKLQDSISLLFGYECQINTIFYRENGIININFSKEYAEEGIRHYNITFRYDGEQVQIVPAKTGREYGEGTYLEALIPSIAAYPDEFPY